VSSELPVRLGRGVASPRVAATADVGINRTSVRVFPDTGWAPDGLHSYLLPGFGYLTPATRKDLVRIPCTIVVLSSVALLGCTPEPQGTGRFNLGEAPEGAAAEATGLLPQLQVHIDSGNAAYREQDYEAALRHYRVAADQDPTEPTAWFGISMAAGALGDQTVLDSAQLRLHRLAPELTTAGH
jgi:hypothetical protein